jgi:WXG100 family type VII secretion target
MAAHTSVTLEGMKGAQGNFQTALGEINKVYNDMSEEAATLAANWTGESASTFGNALGIWLDDLSQVRAQCEIVLESLATHTGIYANTNQTVSDTAGAFGSGLHGLAR